mgnify:CR=1 FL=1
MFFGKGVLASRTMSSSEKPSTFAIAIPLTLAILLGLSVAGLFVAGWLGREPGGVRAEILVESTCADAWAERLLQRAGSVGMGEASVTVEANEARLLATLPGLEDDLEAMPRLLTRGGRLEVFAGEEALGEPVATEADVITVDLGLNLKGHPYVQLELQPAATERLKASGSPLAYAVDGEIVDHYRADGPIRGSEIRIQPRLATVKEELRVATDWNIALRHGPAPCPAQDVRIEVLP